MTEASPLRPLRWVGSSHRDLRAMPGGVQSEMGFALFLAQSGMKHSSAKPLSGFGGAGVLEIVSNHDGDTFRCVYTVRFPSAVYALHAFQKKSNSRRNRSMGSRHRR